MTVKGSDLRELLASSTPDPTLVLVEGGLHIVQVDDLDTDAYRGALLLVSRQELLARGVDENSPDEVLEQQAAAVSTAVNQLGG
ncbi:hypothetical protein Q5530_15410 [Saccharothrix sp. BKS2]|uniref:hypothetical protein n=1 Tax=Saccharothrix sp. BKS2 TaxID=3064400 RepID=UPI0039EA4371